MLSYLHPRLTLEISHSQAIRAGLEPLSEINENALQALSPLLDGSRTVNEIVGELLIANFQVQAIYDVFRILENAGLLVEAAVSLPELTDEERQIYGSQIKFFTWMRSPTLTEAELASNTESGVLAQARLKRASIHILGDGHAPHRLGEILRLAGVSDLTHSTSAESDRIQPGRTMQVYCSDVFDETLAHQHNADCLRRKVPAVYFRRRGTEIECGPLVIPGGTACYRCFTRRRSALLSPLERLWLERGEAIGSLRFPLAVDFLALEILKFLTQLGEPIIQGRLWRFSSATGTATTHTILRVPRCADCSIDEKRPPVKIWDTHA